MSKRILLVLMITLSCTFLFVGCGGSDGKDGAAGTDGATVTDVTQSEEFTAAVDAAVAAATTADLAERTELESCSACHAATGTAHQTEYDKYDDASDFEIAITGVVLAAGDLTMTFTVTDSVTGEGMVFADADAFNDYFNQKTFYANPYDSAAETVGAGISFDTDTITPTATDGEYTITTDEGDVTLDPATDDGFAYAYIAEGELNTEGMTLYDNVSNTGYDFASAAVAGYTDKADVNGCIKCHGDPYMKHGYRAAVVDNLPDFIACKSCHYDSRDGGHRGWQLLVDDPQLYANLALNTTYPANSHDDVLSHIEELDEYDSTTGPAKKAEYDYKATVMNDVHMSHAKEFAYPQSMRNCITCHTSTQLTNEILVDANFTKETCISCHPITGGTSTTVHTDRSGNEYYIVDTTDWALETLVEEAGFAAHDFDSTCVNCHNTGNTYGAKTFAEIHTGYEPTVSTADGDKYADGVVVTIDDVTVDMTALTLTVEFSAASTITGVDAADIVPSVYVAGYGYDTKDFIVSNHDRDADGNRVGEFTFGDENPYFSSAVDNGDDWAVTFDLSALDADGYLTSGVIKRVEVAVAPELEVGDYTVGLNAPSVEVTLATGAFATADEIVDVTKCNDCHAQLATTFHSGDRGGNIVVCRMCHVVGNGGSHLEMQSRSIDSYVHAIHSFQPFDIGDVVFTDEVEEVRYEHHVEGTYPNFTIKNCESCHVAGTYDVPSQDASLPGIFSAADEAGNDRTIGAVPSYVAGPASRACGACHRADMINEDAAGELAAFNNHTKTFGYLEEEDDGVFATIVEAIAAKFE